jgi:hypothetical protein
MMIEKGFKEGFTMTWVKLDKLLATLSKNDNRFQNTCQNQNTDKETQTAY